MHGQGMHFSLDIVNEKGLHARASAKFVQCVERFDAEVTVSKDGQTVSGSSKQSGPYLGCVLKMRPNLPFLVAA